MQRIVHLSIFVIVYALPVLAQQWFTSGQNAQLMVSGAGFNNTGGALFFNHPTGIASDGTRFLVCDRFNNRVLIWNTLPTQWNSLPDIVLGQSTFTGNDPGAGKNNLNWPGNVSVANSGIVVVADTENDRILIWKQFPTVNAQPADISISLPAITPQSGNRYEWPWGVWTNGIKIAAVTTHGNSILFWNTIPLTDNQKPDYVVLLPQFGTPRNISTDGSTYFFVGDHNAKVNGDAPGTFFWNSYPTQANQPYDFYRTEWIKGVQLPDGKLVAGGLSKFYIWNVRPQNATTEPNLTFQLSAYKNGDGPDIVYAGGKLFINNYNGNNILVYNSIPTNTTQQPDFALGSLTPSVNTLDSINYIQNPVVATDGKSLIATSDFDRALWIWKTIPLKSGTKPDLKMSLFGVDLAPWDNALYKGKFVAGGKNKIAIWDALPMNGENPNKVFSNAIGSAQLQEIKGIALDSLYLYAANQSGAVFVWNNSPVTGTENPVRTFTIPIVPPNHMNSDGTYLTIAVQGNPPTVYIYKVTDITASANPLPFKTITSSPNVPLNLPAEAVTFNGSLAIASTSNHSVMMWKNIADAGTANNLIILGQPNPPTYKAAIGANRLFNPASLAVSGNSLWVGELKFSSRIVQYKYDLAASIQKQTDLSTKFLLLQNYPNPFNPVTRIGFSIASQELVTLTISDMLGREVVTLVNETKPAGNYTVDVNAAKLTSGMYFYKLQIKNLSTVRKMIVLK